MQLISALLFALSLISLFCAILFLRRWHNANSCTSLLQVIHNRVGHIGISAIIEYPDSAAPLLALLEEEYPRSEAIVITDLQGHHSPLGNLIKQFHLIKVNHTHLKGVRTLYRSRHRAFRRVVMIDLPAAYRPTAVAIAKSVAAFDYVLLLPKECEVARNTLSYCACIIASYPTTESVSLNAIIGAEARLERVDSIEPHSAIPLTTGRPLAWRKSAPILLMLAIVLPAILLLFAHLSGEKAFTFTAITVALIVALLIYISCCVVTEKGLFTTTNTIIENFCRFLIESIKKIHYLYKERNSQVETPVEEVKFFAQRVNKRKRL